MKHLVYAGFDPTADGLHLGSLAILAHLRKSQAAGHLTYAIIGEATGSIGDPTGKSHARSVIEREQLETNMAGLERDIKAVCPGITVIRNDWFPDFLTFQQKVMRHIPLAKLLSLSLVSDRLGTTGISLMEALYPVMQAYDFCVMAGLAEAENMNRSEDDQITKVVQVGGQDQTGNMSMGLHLLKRLKPEMDGDIETIPLITTATGEKMGKSAGNAIWLAAEKTPDVEFFDMLLSLHDECIEPMSHVILDREAYDRARTVHFPTFKRNVIMEIVKMVRGEAALKSILAVKEGATQNLPSFAMAGLDIKGVLVQSGLCRSNGEVTRMIGNHGIRVNGVKVQSLLDPTAAIKVGDVVSCGKKQIILV